MSKQIRKLQCIPLNSNLLSDNQNYGDASLLIVLSYLFKEKAIKKEKNTQNGN